ncbi:hypothetical protein [Aureispira sp. CCB-E]|uniref:hypothetical protein n=1 Tax=Aureispira sp. CCB-E TaxID=3051121 RepID=UPI00286935B7|nr:hypothetical protein [Aureispira sp. CCB-E]WMX16507.1 hypothetical protein QP953_09025 [Aureispira sp. CCB-E]
MKKKISCTTESFLNNAEYRSFLLGLFEQYEDKFLLANKVQIEMKRQQSLGIDQAKQNKIDVSDDGKAISITYYANVFWKEDKTLTKEPSPQDVSSGVSHLLDKAVKLDNDKYKELNP